MKTRAPRQMHHNWPVSWMLMVLSLCPLVSHAGWEDAVSHRAGNWQWLNRVWLYEAGGNWHWVAGAEVWVYVHDPNEEIPTPTGMVRVQGGTLSTSNELDGTVVSTFHIGRYEVTWGEWQKVRNWAASNDYDIGSFGAGCADDHPVHTVSWYDVVKWCNAKSEREGLTPVYTVDGAVYRTGELSFWDNSSGKWEYVVVGTVNQNLSANGYRLPLEAEWEFAARGGTQSHGYTFSGSNELEAVGWYWDNSGGAECEMSTGRRGTWPVGQKQANELGLYDMSGNAWEWCWDPSNSYRRIRGGGWIGSADFCTVSHRYHLDPDHRNSHRGFRLARAPSP